MAVNCACSHPSASAEFCNPLRPSSAGVPSNDVVFTNVYDTPYVGVRRHLQQTVGQNVMEAGLSIRFPMIISDVYPMDTLSVSNEATAFSNLYNRGIVASSFSDQPGFTAKWGPVQVTSFNPFISRPEDVYVPIAADTPWEDVDVVSDVVMTPATTVGTTDVFDEWNNPDPQPAEIITEPPTDPTAVEYYGDYTFPEVMEEPPVEEPQDFILSSFDDLLPALDDSAKLLPTVTDDVTGPSMFQLLVRWKPLIVLSLMLGLAALC